MAGKGQSWTPAQRAAYDKRMGASLGTSTDTPPKGADTRKSHQARPKVTQDMVEGVVILVNMLPSTLAPKYALTQLEADALVVAITDLAAQNQYVANMIYNLVTVNKLAELPIVASAIVIDKLVIAGRISQLAAFPAQGMLAAVAARRGKRNVNMESGATPGPDRNDGQRQDHPGEGVTQAEGVLYSPGNETGPDTMAGPMGEGQPGS
jgi:hypothetical protein